MQMDSIRIDGRVSLQGKVRVQGSKNAALPILAATLLTKGKNTIYNCPRISDVFKMQQLLQSIGCKVWMGNEHICVDASDVQTKRMPTEAVQGMRSSICMLGVLLSRCREVLMEPPGGCVIGARPIDLHISALEQMGAKFTIEEGLIYGKIQGRFHGADITFPKVSVGATENVILAAVLADGKTQITGAATEPEVIALCEYLNHCGAHIRGIGGNLLVIEGVESLHACEFVNPADRIVAGTYLFAALVAGGSVWLENAPWEQMQAVLEVAKQMGAIYQTSKEGLYVQAPDSLQPIALLQTDIYPGFPTDLQSAAMVAMLKANGESVIEETIFENRFHIIEPLQSMGADLQVLDDNKVLVIGGNSLIGKEVRAKELRGGAALVVAGLMAEGVTTVRGCKYIMRGYENICKDLRELGARVVCE